MGIPSPSPRSPTPLCAHNPGRPREVAGIFLARAACSYSDAACGHTDGTRLPTERPVCRTGRNLSPGTFAGRVVPAGVEEGTHVPSPLPLSACDGARAGLHIHTRGLRCCCPWQLAALLLRERDQGARMERKWSGGCSISGGEDRAFALFVLEKLLAKLSAVLSGQGVPAWDSDRRGDCGRRSWKGDGRAGQRARRTGPRPGAMPCGPTSTAAMGTLLLRPLERGSGGPSAASIPSSSQRS
jgi:hypothetical protein